MPKIKLNAIIQIESGGDPLAFNYRSKAAGLCQIRQIVLDEWNNNHFLIKYRGKDLFNPEINKKIASWYLEEQIPKYLKAYRFDQSVDLILICYNFGIGNVVKWKKKGGRLCNLPKETRQYLIKYNDLTEGASEQ